MKKISIAILISIMLFCSVLFLEFNIYQLACNKNKKDSEELLKIAQSIVGKTEDNSNVKENNKWSNDEEYIDNEKFDNDDTYIVNRQESDIIGILVIEKLQIEAPIRDGTSQEIMKTSVGHFIESDYWNGNVSLASHNSGTSAHYFEKINYLNTDDEIKYITKFGTKKYRVQSINKIESTDWSMVMKNESHHENSENTLTLITCITGQPQYRLCVRAVEA